jgi:hypothetical protein
MRLRAIREGRPRRHSHSYDEKIPAGAGRKNSMGKSETHCFLLSFALGLRLLYPHFLHLSAFLGLVA